MKETKYINLSPKECIELYKTEVKRNKISSIVTLVIMFCVTFGLVMTTKQYWLNIIGMLFAFAVYLTYKGRGVKAFDDLKNIYFVDCDPEKWLKVLDFLLEENPDERYHNTFCMYRADAYFGLGEYENMRSNLSSMRDETRDAAFEMSRIALWENYFFKVGDEKGMNFCLKEFMRIRNEMKIPKQMQSAIHEMEDIRNLHRSILKSDWEETIRIAERRMATSIPAIQTTYRFYIARAYRALGRLDRAKGFFEIVAETRGTLYIKKVAKEELAKMEVSS